MRSRKRRAPSRYEVGTSGPQHPSTARDYYRRLRACFKVAGTSFQLFDSLLL